MKSILIIDDISVFREPLAASLRLAGFTTLTARDGEEGLAMVRERRPDLVLLDLAMPRMDGLAFLSQLRADPAMAATRVIVLTAASENAFQSAVAALGVSDCLLKSRFRFAELLGRIRHALDAPAASAAAA
jgi:CheY-like chemotaxis protein